MPTTSAWTVKDAVAHVTTLRVPGDRAEGERIERDLGLAAPTA